MKKHLLLAAFAAFALPCVLPAQGIRYTVTGTFPGNAPTSTFSAPGANFAFTFLVPGAVPNYTPSNQPFFATATVEAGTYSFNGTTNPTLTGSYEFSASNGNQTSVTLTGQGKTFGFLYGFGANLIGTPDASGLSHFAHGSFSGGQQDVTVTVPGSNGTPLSITVPALTIVGTPVPGITLDVAGFYPANVPTTPLSAPNAAFLVEVTIRNPAPGSSSANFLFASFTFQGTSYPCTVASSYFAHSGNTEVLVLTTDLGVIELFTFSASHLPVLYQRVGRRFQFPLGNLGAGSNWGIYCAASPTPFTNLVTLPSFVSRTF